MKPVTGIDRKKTWRLLISFFALCVLVVLFVLVRAPSEQPAMLGKWTLDPQLSRMVVPDGAKDFPYLQFEQDGSLVYVVGGARIRATYEVDDDRVKVTPSKFDAPIFFGIDGSEVPSGKVVVWTLVAEDLLECRQEGGNGLLFFVRE